MSFKLPVHVERLVQGNIALYCQGYRWFFLPVEGVRPAKGVLYITLGGRDAPRSLYFQSAGQLVQFVEDSVCAYLEFQRQRHNPKLDRDEMAKQRHLLFKRLMLVTKRRFLGGIL